MMIINIPCLTVSKKHVSFVPKIKTMETLTDFLSKSVIHQFYVLLVGGSKFVLGQKILVDTHS